MIELICIGIGLYLGYRLNKSLDNIVNKNK